MRRIQCQAVLVAVVLVAGCSSGGNATTSTLQPTTNTSQATTTTSPATTTATSTTTTIRVTTATVTPATTTAAVETRYAVGDLEFCDRFDPQQPCVSTIFRTEPLPGSGGAAGSGCSPRSTMLPDGMWFGRIVASTATSIDFDLACIYFEGPHYVEKDTEESIENTNPSLRMISVAPAMPVWAVGPGPANSDFVAVPFSDWPTESRIDTGVPCPGTSCWVWLFVNDGMLDEILEQIIAN